MLIVMADICSTIADLKIHLDLHGSIKFKIYVNWFMYGGFCGHSKLYIFVQDQYSPQPKRKDLTKLILQKDIIQFRMTKHYHTQLN